MYHLKESSSRGKNSNWSEREIKGERGRPRPDSPEQAITKQSPRELHAQPSNLGAGTREEVLLTQAKNGEKKSSSGPGPAPYRGRGWGRGGFSSPLMLPCSTPAPRLQRAGGGALRRSGACPDLALSRGQGQGPETRPRLTAASWQPVGRWS